MQQPQPAPPAQPPDVAPLEQLQAQLQAQLRAQLQAMQQTVSTGVQLQVPRTADEVAGIRAVQAELTRQLQAADAERAGIVAAVQETGRVTRPGLEQRLATLDARVLRLEVDLAHAGEQLTRADPQLLARSPAPREAIASVPPRAAGPPGLVLFGPSGPSPNTVAALLLVVVLLQVALLARVRGLFRRRAAAPDASVRDAAERLARLEHAVGAVAEEVERVGEGQRFVTRLLAESRGAPALALPEDTLDALPRGATNG